MTDIKVAIIMGSESDAEEMKPASDILNDESILASYKRNIARIVEKTKNGRFVTN